MKFKPSKPRRTLCQATRIVTDCVEVESSDRGHPFVVSDEVASRLNNQELQPLEAYRLATIHGWGSHLLHYDFYDPLTGVAVPAYEDDLDEDAEQTSFPPIVNLSAISSDLAELIEYHATVDEDDQRKPDIIEALSHFSVSDILKELDRRFQMWATNDRPHPRVMDSAFRAVHRLATRNDQVLVTAWLAKWAPVTQTEVLPEFAAALCAANGVSSAAQFLRDELTRRNWPAAPEPLAPGTPLPHTLVRSASFRLRHQSDPSPVIDLIGWMLSKLDVKDCAHEITALHGFRDSKVLPLIEQLIIPAQAAKYGQAAALNRFDGPTALKWLASDNALAEAALNALRCLKPFDPTDQHLSGSFRSYNPSLSQPIPDQDTLLSAVDSAALRLGTPWARDTAKTIRRYYKQIVDPARRPR